MKKPKIYIIKLSQERDDGSRVTLQRDLYGTFETAGNANLVLKYLRENVYKKHLSQNDGTNKNAPMWLVNVEY